MTLPHCKLASTLFFLEVIEALFLKSYNLKMQVYRYLNKHKHPNFNKHKRAKSMVSDRDKHWSIHTYILNKMSPTVRSDVIQVHYVCYLNSQTKETVFFRTRLLRSIPNEVLHRTTIPGSHIWFINIFVILQRKKREASDYDVFNIVRFKVDVGLQLNRLTLRLMTYRNIVRT